MLDGSNFNITDDDDEYTPNPIWDIVDSTITNPNSTLRLQGDDVMSADWAEIYNEDMAYGFVIKRRPLYYMINNIYPSLILNVISLLAFFLPFASQIGLCNIFLIYFYFIIASILK